LNDQWHHMFANQARDQDVGDHLNAPDVSKFTLTEAKDAFTYVLENVIENENVTRALKHEGIDNIISFVKLTDDIVDNLAYHDPSPNIKKLQKLKIGRIGLFKSFIHYVHFREETNPNGNDWKSITMDDFDQFRANLTYTRRFASLSSLQPLDMMYVDDAPNLLDITDVPDVTNASDDSHDLSSTFDISQFTTTGEQLMVSHNVDKEDDANDPVLLSSSSSPSPCRPPYPKPWSNINLHGMSAYEFLKIYGHEMKTEVAPDNAITEDPQVDEVDPEPTDILLNNVEKGGRPNPLSP
jgi:hypothetical protein